MGVDHDPRGDTAPSLLGEESPGRPHDHQLCADPLRGRDDRLCGVVSLDEAEVALDLLGGQSGTDRVDHAPASLLEVRSRLRLSTCLGVGGIVEEGTADVVVE